MSIPFIKSLPNVIPMPNVNHNHIHPRISSQRTAAATMLALATVLVSASCGRLPTFVADNPQSATRDDRSPTVEVAAKPATVSQIDRPNKVPANDLCMPNLQAGLIDPAAWEVPPEQLVAPAGVAPRINDTPPPGEAPPGMVWVPGGIYWRGSMTSQHHDARPWHLVEVDGFWMDATPVTNEQFSEFVTATQYVTVAEKTPTADELPGANPKDLVAGSVVFTPPAAAVPLNDYRGWWSFVPGANWQHPEGPKSNLAEMSRHPVMHVAYADVQAYCQWAGKRLPTEAEFEFASRGGLDRNRFAWGNQFMPGGKHMANTWQGKFPYENTDDDGFVLTSPVGSFPANHYGLYDMAGNVWQWCADWYRPDYYLELAAEPQPVRNPRGPDSSNDPEEPGQRKHVIRGGSYLCTDQYCTAYEVGARGKEADDSGTNHLSFRCVKSAK